VSSRKSWPQSRKAKRNYDADEEQFYGMREFGFEDPEGWVITIAEKIK
jgi:hypothetical protein